MRIIDNIPVYGWPIDHGALVQIAECARHPQVVHCALMADHHKGYAVPIGGVVAYDNAISPSGVGYDIGCGNKAVRLLVDAQYVRENISTIMDKVWKEISFGIGRKNATPVEHPLFDSGSLWSLEANKDLKQLAYDQLGTVGSGNHYVDVFEDELGRIWVGVHFGSRGLGHKTATWFLNAGGAKDGMDVPPLVLPMNSDLGQQYQIAMSLAGMYAYAGRDWVCQKVADIIGGHIVEEVHNHHNYAWLETHNGKSLWVVRKGATPAFPGQRGFVGGTMCESAVIIEGMEAGMECENTLYSTIHGAGRVMGRREAAGKYRTAARWRCQNYRKCEYTAAKGGYHKDENGPTPKCPNCGSKLRLETMKTQVAPGKVTNEMMDAWVKKSHIELRGAGLDESPDCYKRLPEVLNEMGSTIRVLHTLTPLGVAMAGANEFDPYKD
jgi:tRNA-splicing ligase RtcB (3'-phosphate/5'-hydroxy nucleic acid ligase)